MKNAERIKLNHGTLFIGGFLMRRDGSLHMITRIALISSNIIFSVLKCSHEF